MSFVEDAPVPNINVEESGGDRLSADNSRGSMAEASSGTKAAKAGFQFMKKLGAAAVGSGAFLLKGDDTAAEALRSDFGLVESEALVGRSVCTSERHAPGILSVTTSFVCFKPGQAGAAGGGSGPGAMFSSGLAKVAIGDLAGAERIRRWRKVRRVRVRVGRLVRWGSVGNGPSGEVEVHNAPPHAVAGGGESQGLLDPACREERHSLHLPRRPPLRPHPHLTGPDRRGTRHRHPSKGVCASVARDAARVRLAASYACQHPLHRLTPCRLRAGRLALLSREGASGLVQGSFRRNGRYQQRVVATA